MEREFTRSWQQRYGFSLAGIVLASLLSHALAPLFGGRAPLSPFTILVILAAWYGGLWAGLFTTALSMLAAQLLFGSSMLSLVPIQPGVSLLISFAILGAVISVVLDRLLRSHQDVLAAKLKLEELNKELLAQTSALERSNGDLQRFAYAVSHDLQTPLRNVGAFAELLIRRNQAVFDQDSKEFSKYVLDGVANMNKMILGLLEYSRATHQDDKDAVTDANKVFNDTLQDFQQAIVASGAVITAGPLPAVECQDSMLLQVFQNLIGNALKYHNDRSPEIHVSARRDKRFWIFSVRDNGIGMDMRNADQIFELFKRLHSDGHFEGTGVGLAICKRIVERQGGKIWVESQVGKGSTFYFSIPGAPEKSLRP